MTKKASGSANVSCPTCGARVSSKNRARMSQAASERLQGRIGAWFEANPRVRVEVLELWLTMAERGETDWSAQRLHRELRANHGFPYTSSGAFLNWMMRQFGQRYERAQAGRG